jgi:nitrogen fixation NifU-like protein
MLRRSLISLKYSNQVVLRYQNALRRRDKNIGQLDKNDPSVGFGNVGSGACGDLLSFYLKIEDDKIKEVKYQTFGCGSAIASSSYAAEYLINKGLDEAMGLTNREIAKELSLPPVKLHCSLLAEEAIKSAVNNYRSKKMRVAEPAT